MSISFQEIYEPFIEKIIKDIKFFNYYDKTADEAMYLATSRMFFYMREAIVRMKLECELSENITLKIDNIAEEIIDDLTDVEIQLIVNLMYESHMSRYEVELKELEKQFSPKDLVSNPISQNRATYMGMLNDIRVLNKSMIDSYNMRDRETNRRRTIDYVGLYDETEG